MMYVAEFDEAIYVLHCFQKKSLLTSRQDKAIATARYKTLAQLRSVK
ncbi:type II toxin-antitoxin system RelE/ParE family toxin [Massilia sp. BJB1822]